MSTPNKNELKLHKSNIFLTITLDDRKQHVKAPSELKQPIKFKRYIKKRLDLVEEDYNNYIKPLIDDNFTTSNVVMELSEAMVSKGQYFGRLHFHILGWLDKPVLLMMSLGILHQLGYGYHIISDLKEEEFQDKILYIKKQREQMSEFFKDLPRRPFPRS